MVAAAPTRSEPASAVVREIAPDVHWLALGGRTQTNVYLVGAGSTWTLIDTGWAGDASAIAMAAERVFGPAGSPSSIILTHVHPDHAGAARELARRWDCPIDVPREELAIAVGDFAAMAAVAGPLDRWLIMPLMHVLGRRRREAIIARSSLEGFAQPLGTGTDVPGLPNWKRIPTPGHTPGHVSFFRSRDRVLITGDAIVTLRVNSLAGVLAGRQGLSGPPWYTTWSAPSAASSIEALARLEPSIVAGGHGRPVVGPGATAALRELASRSRDSHRAASADAGRAPRS